MKKFKEWYNKTGFTNVAYFGAAVFCLIKGWPMMLGASIGIFVYVNVNAILKIVNLK